ncbi:MAG: heavy-metal-associated domain-containing protein [Acidobacteriota bacterium]
MQLTIDGMHCDACVRRVRKALENLGDVPVEEVTVGSATVDATSEQVPAVLAAIQKAGYTAKTV